MSGQPILMDQFLALVLEVFEKDNQGADTPQVQETRRLLREGIALLRLDRSKMSPDQLRQHDEIGRAWLMSLICMVAGSLGIAAVGFNMRDKLITQAAGLAKILKN